MKKYPILFAILLLPGLIFIFFNSMQPDYQPLPKLGIRTFDPNIQDTIYHTIQDFEFVAHTGKVVNSDWLGDYIYVANFFFTSCPSPDFCPKMSKSMNLVQSKFYGSDDVKLLSITVDPERDSVPVLAKYAEEYKAVPNKWYFLTGQKSKIYDLIKTSYLLSAIDGDDDPDAFIHTDKFVLIDKSKRIRGYYSGRDEQDVKNLITDIKILQQEYSHQTVRHNKIEDRGAKKND
ncbi:MAG: SCO family protein [Bacteroidetes bacterium]|nr:MAG: SCO family protein [Bacteroidota bacterium]